MFKTDKDADDLHIFYYELIVWEGKNISITCLNCKLIELIMRKRQSYFVSTRMFQLIYPTVGVDDLWHIDFVTRNHWTITIMPIIIMRNRAIMHDRQQQLRVSPCIIGN